MNIEINPKALSSLLFFNRMLTPKIITLVYWVGLLASMVGGVVTMTQGYRGSGVFAGLSIMIVGPFLVRIWCELFIVLFKIEEHLRVSHPNNETES